MTTVNIGTAEELQNFATRVNAGETTLDVVLTADIDLTGVTWTPIGTSAYPYAGTFDGNGKVISNLTISSSTMVSGGLFAYTQGATIQHVGMDIVNIRLTSSSYPMAGALIGIVKSDTVVTKCYTSNVYISTYSSAGGIVGQSLPNGVTITDCYSMGTSLITTRTGYGGGSFEGASGICGLGKSTVTNCYAKYTTIHTGDFPGKTNGFGAGGIAQTQQDSGYNTVVSNCVSLTSTITQTSTTNFVCARIVPLGSDTHATLSNNYGLNPTATNSASITSGSLTDNNGANVSSSEASSESWWKITSGLGWDFTDTWYWDSTTNLPKLRVFKPALSVDISDGTTWSNGTPYVYDTEWLQGEKLHVYTSSGWTEKV